MLLVLSACLLLFTVKCDAKWKTLCQMTRESDRQYCLSQNVGCFNTQCNADGSFKQPQISGSTGYSWCVDHQGIEIPGTRHSSSQTVATCDDFKSTCEKKRDTDITTCGAAADCFITQCLSDGSFRQPQVYGFTGSSWCVDGQGNMIPGTDRAKGQVANCEAAKTACQRRRDREEELCCSNRMCCHVTQCTPDGCFAPMQLWIHIHRSWCADEQGQKIVGTERGPLEGRANCATNCQNQRDKDKNRCIGMTGCFVTQCNPDGTFTQPQIDAGSGVSFCVDGLGNKISNTEQPAGQDAAVCTAYESLSQCYRCGNCFPTISTCVGCASNCPCNNTAVIRPTTISNMMGFHSL